MNSRIKQLYDAEMSELREDLIEMADVMPSAALRAVLVNLSRAVDRLDSRLKRLEKILEE